MSHESKIATIKPNYIIAKKMSLFIKLKIKVLAFDLLNQELDQVLYQGRVESSIRRESIQLQVYVVKLYW